MTESALTERINVEVAPGLTLNHWVTTILAEGGLPTDGHWGVAHTASDTRINNAFFRTLHAAAQFALRITTLADWTAETIDPTGLDRDAFRHAEAHAHEVDAVYPAGSVVEMGGGPNIIDDTGNIRRVLAGAPFLEFEKNDQGVPCCVVCGQEAMWEYGA